MWFPSSSLSSPFSAFSTKQTPQVRGGPSGSCWAHERQKRGPESSQKPVKTRSSSESSQTADTKYVVWGDVHRSGCRVRFLFWNTSKQLGKHWIVSWTKRVNQKLPLQKTNPRSRYVMMYPVTYFLEPCYKDCSTTGIDLVISKVVYTVELSSEPWMICAVVLRLRGEKFQKHLFKRYSADPMRWHGQDARTQRLDLVFSLHLTGRKQNTQRQAKSIF